MAISKRLRYEVLRRDNHQCRYCGAAAPDVKLTIDHVIPTTLGGGDEPSNLVAACGDCNAGKSSSNPDQPLVDTVTDDAVRWAKAMQQAAEERAQGREAAAELHRQFIVEWEDWTNGYGHTTPLPGSWPSTVDQLLRAGLNMGDLHELITVAMESKANDTWRYFCGCCWKRVRQLQERAQEIVRDSYGPRPGPTLIETVWTTEWVNEFVTSNERYGSGYLPQESIDSAHCAHREWGEGDCGDQLCRIVRAAWIGNVGYCKDVAQSRDARRENAIMDLLDEAEVALDG